MLDNLIRVVNSTIPDAELTETALPQCPDITLTLLQSAYPAERLSHEQAAHLMEFPPYWAFCWASGQVLARYFLNHPELVAGKTLVDFGAGSGVVAIAAKKAGAIKAIVCDSDPIALQACQVNAQLNEVEIEYCEDYAKAPDTDLITAADVFYDRDNLPLLESMQQRFGVVWVSDSRLKGQALPGMKVIDHFDSHTVPDLQESIEFNHVCLYRSDEL